MPATDQLFRCAVNFRDYQSHPNHGIGVGGEAVGSSALRRQLAGLLDQGRPYLEPRLLAIFANAAKTRSEITTRRDALPQYVKDNIAPFVTYLVRYLRTGDEVWLYLYAGDTLRLVEDLERPAAEAEQELDDLLQRERRCFVRFLKSRIPPEGVLLFQKVHDAVASLIRRKPGKELRVLFVGDCLFSDVIQFLRPKCADDGVTLIPARITSKNPAETRQMLIEFSRQKFDAVFWSPFTYENLREYGHLLSWKGRKVKGDALSDLLNEIIRQTRETADVLAKFYDCSVFVHNCGGFKRRDTNSLGGLVKSIGTARTRRTARDAINRWLQPYIEDKNAATFDHLFVLDEEGLVKTFGENTVGKFIFHGEDLHTAMFGKILADFYRDIVFVLARLHTKKLIVSDLDNTLWRGTIGEAGVSPILERQELLGGLKKKGVLLAVCSKNNPQDVSWQGNHLGASDFVAARINWEPKPHNLRSIESELKLKRKDFVFIDDSPLERELMAAEFPEVVVLNPDEDQTWRLLRLWTTLLGRGSSEDRTSYYLNEKNRSQSLETSQSSSGDLFEALSNLRLKVKVRDAEKSDLQRAVELINRTNQFNLCGSRTTFREMQGWLNSSDHRIVIGQAEDKFGSMGIVCIAVVQLAGNAARIPVFVLSCRVIGYGIESAVLNYVCATAQAAGAESVIGQMKLTSHNEPCRRMYPDAGFAQQDDGSWRSNASQIPTSPWLTIECDLAAVVS